MKGNLIIISSPSGGGKGTLIKEVFRKVPKLAYSVSYTTRRIRIGEVDGRDYFFISTSAFEDLIANSEFLEYALVHGNYYGTSLKQVDNEISKGNDMILEIDVQGARSVINRMPDAVGIFILPPSFETLRDRLVARATENPKDQELRLENSFDEVSQFHFFEYVVVNTEINEASEQLGSIILAERLKRIRQTEVIQDILDSFDVIVKNKIGG
jgi:guanylate kinase